MKKNHFYLLLSLLIIFACRSNKYYASVKNPFSIGLKVFCEEPVFYTNDSSSEKKVQFYLYNFSNSEFVLPQNMNEVFQITGFSRFNQHPFYCSFQQKWNPELTNQKLPSNDSILIIEIDLYDLLQIQSETIWYKDQGKTKKVKSPAYVTKTNTQPYCRIRGEYKAGDRWIVSNELIISVGKKIENKQNYKNLELKIAQVSDKKDPNILPKITCSVFNNTGNEIPLFNDPGSVRFILYGYSKNRTSVMKLLFKQSGNSLNIKPVTVKNAENKIIFEADVEDLLLMKNHHSDWYWSWNKKNPPVSPALLKNGKKVKEVELWFGIIVNGKEYQSNTIKTLINHD